MILILVQSCIFLLFAMNYEIERELFKVLKKLCIMDYKNEGEH